jgi:hypothetical protein
MSTTQHVWRAHRRSLGNAARYDRRYRIGLSIIVVFGVLAAAVGAPRLAALVAGWQAGGVLAVRLWVVCGSVWLSVGVLAALNTAPLSFGAPEAHVLWSLPLVPAARFRVLWGVVVIEGVWSGLVIVAAVVGGALAATLGWRALPWLFVLTAGFGVALWCGIVVVLAARQAAGRRWLLVLATLAVAGMVLVAGATDAGAFASIELAPGWSGAVLSVLLGVLLGPLAGAAGRLYEQAFLRTLRRDQAQRRMDVPGALHLTRWLLRRRSLAGALLGKGILNRGRSKLNLLRFGAPVLYVALVPWISSVAGQHGVAEATLVGMVATALVLGVVSETVPSPLGGEGNRLALLLTTPLSHGTLLWAKWTAWVVPVLGYAMVFAVVLGVWRGISATDLLATLSGMVLVLGGNAALWVWGSAWDADLDATVTGPEQAMLVEELPITPWRIMLIGINGVFAAAAWALMWLLPLRVALPLLALLDLLVYVAMWWCGLLALRRLTRSA